VYSVQIVKASDVCFCVCELSEIWQVLETC